jgi:hypothetical protein
MVSIWSRQGIIKAVARSHANETHKTSSSSLPRLLITGTGKSEADGEQTLKRDGHSVRPTCLQKTSSGETCR